MILAVVGGRNFKNWQMLHDTLTDFIRGHIVDEIVSGGAQGADTMAELFAFQHEIKFKEFPPNWEKYGKSAGYRRNKLIINRADELIAFPGGKGTYNSVQLAEKKGIPVHRMVQI